MESFYGQFSDFGPKCPNMEIWAQSQKILNYFDFFDFIIIGSPKRFQRALNDLTRLSWSHFMAILVILVPNVQIWKFGTRPPNFEFF